jgi:hypothetical protein
MLYRAEVTVCFEINTKQINKAKQAWTGWTLNMGPIGCPETSVPNCAYMLRNIPEERTSL